MKLFFFVEDTGKGIHSNYHKDIFLPFRKLSDDKGDVISGVGLGLYHASKILQKMGGELFVLSQPNNGSTFYFCLQQ